MQTSKQCSLACFVSDVINAYLRGICCLNFTLDSIKLSPEPVFGACIEHLVSYPGSIRRPCDEKYFALLTVFFSHKVKVINSISALLLRKGSSEVVISLARIANLVHSNLLQLLINLERYKTMGSLTLQLQEFNLAFAIHSHS